MCYLLSVFIHFRAEGSKHSHHLVQDLAEEETVLTPTEPLAQQAAVSSLIPMSHGHKYPWVYRPSGLAFKPDHSNVFIK